MASEGKRKKKKQQQKGNLLVSRKRCQIWSKKNSKINSILDSQSKSTAQKKKKKKNCKI